MKLFFRILILPFLIVWWLLSFSAWLLWHLFLGAFLVWLLVYVIGRDTEYDG